MIKHHPDPELILDYAAGALPEAMSLIVATHLSQCELCRHEANLCDHVGGGLIDELAPTELSAGALDRVLGRLDGPDLDDDETPSAAIGGDLALPGPLRRYLAEGMADLNWRGSKNAVQRAPLGPRAGRSRASFLRISPGYAVPPHTHRGNEYTLVLSGGYSVDGQAYGPGDFQAAGPELTHQPIADEGDPCLCLTVLDAPLKFTSGMPRLLNPFMGY